MTPQRLSEVLKRHNVIAVFGVVPVDAYVKFGEALKDYPMLDAQLAFALGAVMVIGKTENLNAVRREILPPSMLETKENA